MMQHLSLVLLASLCAPVSSPDTAFIQEYHQPAPPCGANDIKALAVDETGQVWAATGGGVFSLAPDAEAWESVPGLEGPALDVLADGLGTVWVGAWNGLYRSPERGGRLEKVPGIEEPIATVCTVSGGIVALGPEAMWRLTEDGPVASSLPCARSVRSAVAAEDGGLWIATGMGLYLLADGGVSLHQTPEEIVSCDVCDVAYDRQGRLWAAGLGGLTAFTDGKRSASLTTEQGLPNIYVHALALGPDGRLWVGSDLGVARWDGHTWSLRHGRRWLVSDDVRDIAFDKEGTAWIATAEGVSTIRRRSMTLAQKEKCFQELCSARHVREPYLVEKCRLTTPGDPSTWEPEDDDNDGQYTNMYLAAECFHYAVTKDPDAKARAKKAFDAMHFLQTVTETTGFMARTVVPREWKQMHDPGDSFTPETWALRRIADPRYKKVEVRWRPSKDGKWLWKGDTSSDEMTGHFYGYCHYYDLVADEAEKAVVRDLAARIMDYIIEGGYVYRDIDGTHTRWAVWSPEKLNHDPDWAAERGINSVEILAYLKATYHMTGDEKYQKAYLELLHEHGYAENVRRAKTFAPAWRTHIDDELLALAYFPLLQYETDPELCTLFRESIDGWYGGIEGDQSPYFNYLYAGLTGENPHPDESLAFLRDCPLDCISWTVDNSTREDLQLVRKPEIEPLQTDRLVPASERGVVRWDKNPWAAVQGDGGRSERAPTHWLLPYWMGRYYGFIGAPYSE